MRHPSCGPGFRFGMWVVCPARVHSYRPHCPSSGSVSPAPRQGRRYKRGKGRKNAAHFVRHRRGRGQPRRSVCPSPAERPQRRLRAGRREKHGPQSKEGTAGIFILRYSVVRNTAKALIPKNYNQRRSLLSAARSALCKSGISPYLTVPFSKSYIGPPSAQLSFRKSDLYIGSTSRHLAGANSFSAPTFRHSFPTAKV